MNEFNKGDEVLIMSGRYENSIGNIEILKASVGHGGVISRVRITSGKGAGSITGVFQSRFELISRGKCDPNLMFKHLKGRGYNERR